MSFLIFCYFLVLSISKPNEVFDSFEAIFATGGHVSGQPSPFLQFLTPRHIDVFFLIYFSLSISPQHC